MKNLLVSQTHQLYSLSAISNTTKQVVFRFEITPELSTTARMKGIVGMLESLQPSVLKTKCYNYRNQSFRKELLCTETAHLFEHLLIDWMVTLKLQQGATHASFRAETSWNWRNSPKGTFVIIVTMLESDHEILPEAIQRASRVFNALLPQSIAH